jgi:hypothetical protein
MKRFSSSTALLSFGLLLVGTMGCVDQEASISLRGFIQLQGEATQEDVECGSGMNAETRAEPVLSCETEIDPGSIDTFLTRLTINVRELENQGQLGPPIAHLSNLDYCNFSYQEYITRKYRHASFFTSVDMVNNLSNSQNVGAEGQGGGGGGGGFEGIRIDTNSVQLDQLLLRFPEVSGTGGGETDIDKDIKSAGLLESDGGALTLSFKMFKQEEVPALRALHEQLVLERTSLNTYNDRARRTTITVQARLWAKGQTLSETDVASNKIQIPVDICGRGCDMTPSCAYASDN